MQTPYSPYQIVLHWLSAIIIIWSTISGFWVSFFEMDPAVKNWVSFFNISLTTLFIPVFAVRIYLAYRQPSDIKAEARTLNDSLALWAHRGLYGLTTVVLLTGVMMMDRPINIFGLVSIPQPLDNPELIDVFFKIHVAACWILALLIGLHIAAVIKHEISGNPVMKRMSLKSSNDIPPHAPHNSGKEESAQPK